MALFYTLLFKLTPLYINIFLGYLAGKKLGANRDTIAKIMFFIINPLVVFNGVLITNLDFSILSLPFLIFGIACLMCLFFYRMSRKIWENSSKNMMAFSAGSGNTGYFGLPVALAIFNTPAQSQGEGIYIMALLGINLYENSLGYYISAKNSRSTAECLSQLLRLPTIYAFLIALLLNLTHFPVPEFFREFMGHIKGVYVVLGMMIVGLGLSSMTNFKLDFKYIGMTFLAKFFAWPVLILLIVFVDANYLGFYNRMTHQVMMILSVVPLAVNSVVMASLMKCDPEKVAAAVLLSTFFALIYVPIMAALFIH